MPAKNKLLDRYEVHVLVGLPGAGKTTWATQEEARRRRPDPEIPEWRRTRDTDLLGAVLVDLDKKQHEARLYGGEKRKHRDFYDFANYCSWFGWFTREEHQSLILDGLTISHDAQEGIAQAFGELLVLCQSKASNKKVAQRLERTTLVYHVWAPDRESCLLNDAFRRPQSAKDVIKHASFQEPDAGRLRERFPRVEIVEHETKRKSEYQLFQDYFGFAGARWQSADWTTGGEYGTYTGARFDYDPESPPGSCEKFDQVLEALDPAITFLQYRKLYGRFVTTGADTKHGYYNSVRHYAYHVIDVEALYEHFHERFSALMFDRLGKELS